MDGKWAVRRRRHRRQCPWGSTSRNRAGQADWPLPSIRPLTMVTTPLGVPGNRCCPDWVGASSPHRSTSARSLLSEVNHRLESRMREIRLSGLEGGGTDNRFSLSLSKARLRRAGHEFSRKEPVWATSPSILARPVRVVSCPRDWPTANSRGSSRLTCLQVSRP